MSKKTRRQFLEDSLFAAAAAATATCVSSDIWAAGGARRPAGPNDTIRVAVIGVNGRGREHIDALAKLNDMAEIATVCDCDTKPGMRAVKLVEDRTNKTPRFEQDLRKVFDDKSIDAVTIATTNHWHAL